MFLTGSLLTGECCDLCCRSQDNDDEEEEQDRQETGGHLNQLARASWNAAAEHR